MASVSVAEAAKSLGVGVSRIHQRIADGSLRAERVGSQWVVDELSLLRVAERHRPGRPLSARSAWAIIALAEGDEESLRALAPGERDGHLIAGAAAEQGRGDRRFGRQAALGRGGIVGAHDAPGVLGAFLVADDNR